jgi:hypothetical protein
MGRYDDFAQVAAPKAQTPWKQRAYRPDIERLGGLLSVCAADAGKWKPQEGGDLGAALDLWVADELRRAGYEPDAVWPRTEEPRVLPAAIASAMGKLSKADQKSSAMQRLRERAGASAPVVLGEFFAKKVDVLVADWDRGVEIMVSTKAMTGSFGNNMNNRWEEFTGDLRNMRGRFPLAVLGIVYLADVAILKEHTQFKRLLDMLRKLRMETLPSRAYDSTALVLAKATGTGKAVLQMKDVPVDVAPPQFFERLLAIAWERLPVSERATARELYGKVRLPTAEVQPSSATQLSLNDDE